MEYFCKSEWFLHTKPPKHIGELHAPFKLPITYLDKVFPLSETVATDLELTHMYSFILQPKHVFAQNMVAEWRKQYTTDIAFLKDSQEVVKDMVIYESRLRTTPPDCESIMKTWNSIKNDEDFYEKYSYIEWDCIKQFNESEPFLQTLSVMNLSSPLLSLILPLLFFICPFIILKLQGVPITLGVYFNTLKNIAKNHVIGKMLNNLQSITMEKLSYVLVSIGLYVMQIYQNIIACLRFYKNIQKVNRQLCEMREFLEYSIDSMDVFCDINKDRATYSAFCKETATHIAVLKEFGTQLDKLRPFAHNISKMMELGYLLKCLYIFYSNVEYTKSMRYAIGFEGYINNMLSINALKLPAATFDGSNCDIRGQYYPANEVPVTNHCNFNKNMVITGPNASGKTTLLKTTTINIIFTQQFGCGFYKACSLNPYDYIHSYLNIPDTSGRDSLFQAESRRCKEIIDIIGTQSDARHFCIFDELYSGTNPIEATKSAYAFLIYLTKYKDVDFILTTHYVSMCSKLKNNARIQNYKMDVDLNNDKLTYTYKIKKGVSKVHGAIKILEEMNYPAEIIDTIKAY